MSKTKKKRPLVAFFAGVAVCAVIAVTVAAVAPQTDKSQEPAKEVITVSTLEHIISVSELSTLTAVYNGIAQVMNPKNENEIDYYVSYEAKVNAGIDFEKVKISVDNTEKIVKITIPQVYLTEVNVDISSLDYIFMNDAANTSSVSQEAFKACEKDARDESELQGKIFELARQNAENILTALVRPIIEQLDAEYSLIIE